jgi:hypothetical protein
LEPSLLGVFAAGDVRSGSIKRVASAVGECSMAVKLVHQYLADTVCKMCEAGQRFAGQVHEVRPARCEPKGTRRGLQC